MLAKRRKQTKSASFEADQPPSCPRCNQTMVRRTAKKGRNAGGEFWGCPEFPKCRGVVAIPPTDEPTDTATTTTSRPVSEPATPATANNAATVEVNAAYDDMREQLESDEPDATGRWDAEHRRKVLAYIYARDDGRCGVCAGEMKLSGAHVEHVVPKIFAVFNVRKGGKAEQGIRYTSRLHKLDNLQASHTYCNKRKGNTSDVKKWRHPAMPPLTVADADDGQFVVPYKRSTKSTKHK